MYALVGFCDIHHFEDVNQRLAADVLTFVNTIAEIVHDRVHQWGGQCNKNLGNAFVIIWRIGDEESLSAQLGLTTKSNNKIAGALQHLESMKFGAAAAGGGRRGRAANVDQMSEREEETKKKSHMIDLRRVPGVDTMADRALIGYLKIIADINRNKQVLSYRTEPRLTNGGTDDFKVRMGFGLHAGWAIEGAVGSLQKVDATYLSPHVNMAARLETSSRQYGVPLLASQNFYDLMTPDGQEMCRRVDVVTVKGSEVPIGIYTYDCLQDQEFPDLYPKRRRSSMADSESEDGRRVTPIPLVGALQSVGGAPNVSAQPTILPPPRRPSIQISNEVVFMTPDDDTDDCFERDSDLKALREHVTEEFTEVFTEGVNAYVAGDWSTARKHLEEANSMMAEVENLDGDGPCKTLLSYMEELGWEAPSTWKGFRPLTSK